MLLDVLLFVMCHPMKCKGRAKRIFFFFLFLFLFLFFFFRLLLFISGLWNELSADPPITGGPKVLLQDNVICNLFGILGVTRDQFSALVKGCRDLVKKIKDFQPTEGQ